MIQARKLGHIVLKVRDAAKSRDFYTRTLGLKVAHENLERGAVFLSFGEAHHDLALFQLATGEAPDAAQPGLHHMAWQLGSVAELQAAYRETQGARRADRVHGRAQRDAQHLFPGPRRQSSGVVLRHGGQRLRGHADRRTATRPVGS
jgi:catechol-2,3-dioxygenase